MYEHRTQPLLPPRAFYGRVARSGAVVAGVVLVSLAIGMLGYHLLEHLAWIDAFVNAAMLLGGMGPLDAPRTTAGKLFAGLYALYCGLVVIVSASILLAPIAHRALHRFHLERQRERSG